MAKQCKLALLILALQVSVNTVFADTTTERNNLTKADLLPSARITPTLISAVFGFGSYERSQKCSSNCGQANYRNPQYRIVGGHDTVEHEYPWMAQLSYFGTFFCGGTLINDRYVLTAGHCTNRYFPTYIKVTLGGHNRCSSNPGLWSSYTSRVSAPAFSTIPIFGQDIALLRLSNPAPFNQYIRPILLPYNKESHYSAYAGKMSTVAGWGATRENQRPSCTLREVQMPIISNTECFENSNYKNVSDFLMTNYMMCAGYPQGGYDSCSGDSGGPLMVKRDDGKFEIVGVVSWGIGCARPNYPGVYTRVTKQLEWIRRNVRDGCYCGNEA